MVRDLRVDCESKAEPALSEEDAEMRELLLGKRVTKAVESTYGLFSLEEGTLITGAVLDEAQAHDALTLLILYIDL